MNDEPLRLLNIFSEKSVGIAFAAAFALWAWMLNSMSDKILDSQAQTQRQLMDMQSQATLDRIQTAQTHAEFREQIRQNTRRVDALEGKLEKHNEN